MWLIKNEQISMRVFAYKSVWFEDVFHDW